jgi:hypothetical protein
MNTLKLPAVSLVLSLQRAGSSGRFTPPANAHGTNIEPNRLQVAGYEQVDISKRD